MRGNLVCWWPKDVMSGSIPACAGEPGAGAGAPGDSGVYPRVCGGTDACAYPPLGIGGLSPRVRGNHICSADYPAGRAGRGSIPACAGEPRRRITTSARPAVYPRVCGGTEYSLCGGSQLPGLSPRVRGNQG